MRVDAAKLIQFIVCQATEFGASLSPIRVVKFLYLTDLYHARENKGETLTGWPWRVVYFGPYCGESITALTEAVNDGLINVWIKPPVRHHHSGPQRRILAIKTVGCLEPRT